MANDDDDEPSESGDEARPIFHLTMGLKYLSRSLSYLNDDIVQDALFYPLFITEFILYRALDSLLVCKADSILFGSLVGAT